MSLQFRNVKSVPCSLPVEEDAVRLQKTKPAVYVLPTADRLRNYWNSALQNILIMVPIK